MECREAVCGRLIQWARERVRKRGDREGDKVKEPAHLTRIAGSS